VFQEVDPQATTFVSFHKRAAWDAIEKANHIGSRGRWRKDTYASDSESRSITAVQSIQAVIHSRQYDHGAQHATLGRGVRTTIDDGWKSGVAIAPYTRSAVTFWETNISPTPIGMARTPPSACADTD